MDVVVVEYPTKSVAIVRINRPEARNALNQQVRGQLAACFSELNNNDSIRCIVLTGGDKIFAAGADLKAMSECTPIDIMLLNNQKMWQMLSSCSKPVIAAVNGYALGGGCELAMHADIIIAGESARFGQPEIKAGLMPGAGGTQRLVRTIGKFKAFQMLLTGEPVTAKDAESMGLVSEVVADDQVQTRALNMAIQIASMPPLAVTQIKEVLIAGQDASLETALMLERKAFQLLFASEDKLEGIQAFLEKRTAQFKGK